MLVLFDAEKQFAKQFQILAFRRKSQPVFPKERDDDFFQIIALTHFKSEAMLMVRAGIPLEIDISAAKKFLQLIKRIFLSFAMSLT